MSENCRNGKNQPGNTPTDTISAGEPLPVFLTPDEVAALLRTTRKAIYVRIERRQLPGVRRLGRRLLIRTQILLEWLDQECASSLQKGEQR